MKNIVLGEQVYICQEQETLLDAVLRQGGNIPFSCRQGLCQCCLTRSLNGSPPMAAQKGLKAVQQKLDYFLACLCHPEQDMHISLSPDADSFNKAVVSEKRLLNADTLLLTLTAQPDMRFYAGQFINLRRSDGLIRSYSIANSHLQTDSLSFHIRRLPNGRFSSWLHDDVMLGDSIEISAAQGLCFYLPDNPAQNMVLIGTGSGLAPLVGIVQEALEQGHQGEIHLFHGSRDQAGLYLIEEMRALAVRYPNFHYTPCLSQESAPTGFAQGRANEVALQQLSSLKQWRAYLCGHPDMVNHTKIQLFLKGIASSDIYSDAFHVSAYDREQLSAT